MSDTKVTKFIEAYGDTNTPEEVHLWALKAIATIQDLVADRDFWHKHAKRRVSYLVWLLEERDRLREALQLIAAQDSGKIARKLRSVCMAAIAEAALQDKVSK